MSELESEHNVAKDLASYEPDFKKEAAYEPDFKQNDEKNPIRPFIWVGGIAVLLIVGLIWVVLHLNSETRSMPLENVARAGSSDFDAYKGKLELEVIDKIVYPNMIGLWQLEVKARMHNRGDRPITGVEVLGKMLDMNDKVIAQATSIPIPRIRKDPLKPGESLAFSVKVDAPGKVTEDQVKDIVIELRGLRF
jgi:hypothetical protein